MIQNSKYDLNGDGKEEIILSTLATGNVHYPTQYTDQKNWLFVFDQNLSPIFDPLSFGEYPSGLACLPIEIDKERYLLLQYGYGGEKNLRSFLCLITPEGEIYPKKYHTDKAVTQPVSNFQENPSVFYVTGNQNDLLKINEQLKVEERKSTKLYLSNPLSPMTPTYLIDLDMNGSQELICGFDSEILIFDEKLKLLALFPAPSRLDTITFRETGEGNPLEIGLNSHENFYRFAFNKNALFQAWPISWLGLSGLTFIQLAGGYKFSALIYTYLSFFRFSLIKPPTEC